MDRLLYILIINLFLAIKITSVHSQETPVKYDFNSVASVDYPHGQLPSSIGVHNIQILRANRESPELSDGFGWTYHHAPMIAYWNDSLYVSHLSDSTGEHIPPGQTFLQSSKDGYHWSDPRVLFPVYRIPDGTTKEGSDEVAKDLDAVMHQRMVFYVSKKSKRLFALGYYGICIEGSRSAVDGKGIGRVIREIHENGSLGQIYFIRHNHGWDEKNASYPFYKNSGDNDFIEVCGEILSDPLITLQWVEESDRNDPIIPSLGMIGKAFNYYTLPEGDLIGMWKGGLSGISKDKGQTWSISKGKGLIIGSAKMWGEQTSDKQYVQVFNPSVNHRYPLVASPSGDGLLYEKLLVIHGELSPKRYDGNSKKEGPQYVRGIFPGNGVHPDGNMWLTYSVNKEDIWVSRVTVPILGHTGSHINEDLSTYTNLDQLHRWNIYSPIWAPVSIDKAPNGKNALRLADKDTYDYAKVEHVFPLLKKFNIEFCIIPDQNHHGSLEIELQNDKNSPGIHISLDPDGVIRYNRKHRRGKILSYVSGEEYCFKLTLNTLDQSCVAFVNGIQSRIDLNAPINQYSRIVFRTGEPFRVMGDDMIQSHDLEESGLPINKANFYILNLKTTDINME